MTAAVARLELLNVTKRYPGVIANDDVSLSVLPGEIHAILGENGAGKSTLVKIIYGAVRADHGDVLLNGRAVDVHNPAQARKLGIGMVFQHFSLFETLSVVENIALVLDEPFDLVALAVRVTEVSERYGLPLDPHRMVHSLSVGERQRVEIVRCLLQSPQVLILDEPTSVLTPQAVQKLFETLRHLAREGVSILYISHKLHEIQALCDSATIMRGGKVTGNANPREETAASLARMMIGRELPVCEMPPYEGEVRPLLTITNLSHESNEAFGTSLKHISLTVNAGEIVGIAGVDGNGQTELTEALTGLRKIESGSIRLGDKDISRCSIRERNEFGMAHIPEDRQKRGLVLDYTIEENFILKTHRQAPYSSHGFLNAQAIREHAEKLIEAFDVRSGEGATSLARTMSGGNQQKAIIGREFDLDPELLIAIQPTRGLDVGSIEYIHQRLVEQRDSGKAVLLVSLELDEILDLSDRIAVISNGELIGIVDAATTDEKEVGLMMAGVRNTKGAIKGAAA